MMAFVIAETIAEVLHSPIPPGGSDALNDVNLESGCSP
jgi:hypothetical protein